MNVPTSAAPMRPPRISGDWSQRPHRVDDAENGGDDADRGQAVGDGRERMIGFQPIVHYGLNLLVHQRLDLVRAGVADDDEAHIIANEGRQLPVLQDGRSGPED